MDVQWLLNLPQQIKGGDPSSKPNLTLKAGDLLTASVLEVDKGRDALISIGQFKAYARLPLPVVTGQSIQIQVQQADNGLRMMMVPNKSGQPASDASGRGHPQVGEQPKGSRAMQASGRINPSPTPLTGNDVPTRSQLVDKGMLPANGRINRAQTPSTGNEVQARRQSVDQKMVQSTGNRHPAAIAPGSDNLQIRVFEPVSDRLSLIARSHLLRPGESVEGRVTGFAKDGLILVDFGKFKAFAKIDVPVREGQILPLTVEKSEQGITFSIGKKAPVTMAPQSSSSPVAHGASPEVIRHRAERQTLPSASTLQYTTPSADVRTGTKAHMAQSPAPFSPPTAPEMAQFRQQIQQLLGQPNMPEKPFAESLPPTTQAALTHLQQLLRPVSTTGDITTLMTSIREFVENSGVYFEKRVEAAIQNAQDRQVPMTPTELAQHPPIRDLMVKDLKPNLLILNQFLDSQAIDQKAEDRHVLETMKSVVQRTLAHIEQQQLGATEKPVDPDVFQAFSHLLMLADHRRDARLKVYYAKKGGKEDANKTPRVALLLEMDRMGTVRTDLWMVGKDLNITFFVQTPEIKSAISDVQDEVKSALNEKFNTVALSVIVNENKIEQFDEEDVSLNSRRLLDLSI